MPRIKKPGKSAPRNEAVSAALEEVKRLKKQSRDILKKAGRNVRQVRHDVSKLKKAGLFRPTIDVRTYQPTRYILKKIKRNVDIITGKAVAVKAPKSVRDKYVEKGLFEQRQGRLIVPKEYANQRTRISRGMIEISRSLEFGQERRVYLPFKITDLEDIALRLRDDPSLNGLKQPDELFGFRIFGHNMNNIGFPDADELGAYILLKYRHLFGKKNHDVAVSHFQLVRFRSIGSQMNEGPEEEKVFSPKKRPKVVKDWLYRKRLKKEAARKATEREKETPEQRTARLDKQRIRQSQLRQRKFDEQ